MSEYKTELPQGLLDELEDTLIDNFGAEDSKGVMRVLKTILRRYWPTDDCQTPQCTVTNGQHFFRGMYSGLLGYEPDEAAAYDAWRAAHVLR